MGQQLRVQDLWGRSVFVEGNAVHEVTSDAGAVLYGTAIVADRDPPVFRAEDPVPFCAQ